MRIGFIKFSGPKKASAELTFGPGLNLVYGPSNTGKSSVLDALDFMLGRERKLKEIPQHEGYDQIFLGLEFENNNKFTLIRNISGGDFECFEGYHDTRPKDVVPEILKPKKATKKLPSVSDFILSQIGLEDKKLKKNAENKTVNLTLRNFLPLSVVTETVIQKEASPYISEQYTEKTQDKSLLKFILTGIDDATLLPAEVETKRLSRAAKIDILQELIFEQEGTISETLLEDETPEELSEQLKKLVDTIKMEKNILDVSEEQYNQHLLDRTLIRNELEQKSERISEISEMLTRFELLKQQYNSDILRLENIREAGTLIVSLPSDKCPLCGSETNDSVSDEKCENHFGDIVSAANSEKHKLEVLLLDLLKAMQQLSLELSDIENLMPETLKSLNMITKKVAELNPELTSKRNKYTDLLSTKSDVEKSIGMISQLELLQKKKEDLEEETPEKSKSADDNASLPTKSLFNLSQCVKDLLQDWNFPNSENVYFDNDTEDFVINGKHRASNGKGHRAITHAAATLGLMRYAEKYGKPHFGFSIIDSPLLAYEEPENDDDDLTGTDVNLKFFDYLSNWTNRQIIVFENRKSIPDKYSKGKNITYFTKGLSGRYGFFPVID